MATRVKNFVAGHTHEAAVWSFDEHQNLGFHELLKHRHANRAGTAKIKVKAGNPFAEGGIRYAFSATMWCNGKEYHVVAKRLKEAPEGAHQFRDYAREMETQFVARVFAAKFKKVTKALHLDWVKHINFTWVWTMYVNRCWLDVEPKLKGPYLKYNNNQGDVLNLHLTLEAFSHWTYYISGGKMMVVDLQGVQHGTTFTLTDPVVHCTDPHRFSQGNWGVDGMKKFFKKHKCNVVCQALGISR